MKMWNVLLIIVSLGLLHGCSTPISAAASTTTSLASSGRTIPTTVNDQLTSYKVSRAIYQDPNLRHNNRIVVAVYDRIILLTGQAQDDAAKAQAEAIAKKVAGDRIVYNDLSIGTPITALVQGGDGLITTNVKMRMFSTTNLRASRIKVITENYTVYLMGQVSRSQGRIAAEIARNSTGVQKVVKLFQYTNV